MIRLEAKVVNQNATNQNVPIGFHSAGGNTICTQGTLYVLHDLYFRNAICTTLFVRNTIFSSEVYCTMMQFENKNGPRCTSV